MEKILDSIIAVSTNKSLSDDVYEQQMRHIVHSLNKIGANHLVASPGGVDLLDVYNPAEQSIGYLYILLANIRAKTLEHTALWERTITFLEVYNARQISFASDQFKALIDEILKFVNSIGKPILAIRPLRKSILRSADPSKFTCLHTWLLQKCLEAKCYRDASAILDIHITEISSKKGQRDAMYQESMLYFLYGGMIYIGLKNWGRALEFFGNVITFPGMACSTIQVEAYKKYILVGLLLDGKQLHPPHGTAAVVARSFRILTKPYEAFAQSFASRNVKSLRSHVNTCMPIFAEDGNVGLVNQCLTAFKRYYIATLTHNYVTLSVKDIRRRDFEVTGAREDDYSLESYLLGMIERHEISASLSHTNTGVSNSGCIVEFRNDAPVEKEILANLESQIMQVVSLTNQATAMERTLGLTKQYIQHSAKQGRAGKFSSGWSMFPGDPDAMDTGDVFERLQRTGTGYSLDDLGDEDVMVQDSFDEEY